MRSASGRPRPDLLWASILPLLVLVLFFDLLLLGRGLYVSDLFNYHYAMKKIVRDLIFSGDFPYWNPFFSGGQPLAANPVYELYYPLQWFILLPSYRLGFQLHILVHLVVAGIGMFVLLRSLKVSAVASLFGALVFAFGGPYFSLIIRLPLLLAMAWSPWIFFFARRLVLRRRLADLALASACLSMQLLIGEPTVFAQTVALVFGYAGYRVWSDRRSGVSVRPVAQVTLVLLGALILGALQIVPAIDHAADSVRGEGFSWRVSSNWSMPPARLVELVYPQIFRVLTADDGRARIQTLYPFRTEAFLADVYLGAIAIVLVLAGLLRGTRGRITVLAVCAGSVLVALGEHAPVWRALFGLGVGQKVRFPEKFFLTAAAVLVVWAAINLDAILRGDRRLRRTAITLVIVWTALAALIGLAAHQQTPMPAAATERPVPWASYWMLVVMRGVIATALVMTSTTARRGWWAAGLVGFTVFDLFFIQHRVAERMPRRFFEQPEVVAELAPERNRYRVFHEAYWEDWKGTAPRGPADYQPGELPWMTRNGLFPFSGAIWGFRSVMEDDIDQTGLFSSTYLLEAAKQVDKATGAWPPFLLAASNVRYVARFLPPSAEQPADLSRRQVVNFHDIGEHPRYYAATELVKVSGLPEFVDALKGQTVNPRAAFVDFDPFRPAAASVVVMSENPTHVHLQVNASAQTFVVASVSAHKYWKASLDGRPIPLHLANLGYQGAVVPAGQHRLELRYRNPLVLPTALVSLAGWIVVIALLLLRGRRAQSSSP